MSNLFPPCNHCHKIPFYPKPLTVVMPGGAEYTFCDWHCLAAYAAKAAASLDRLREHMQQEVNRIAKEEDAE